MIFILHILFLMGLIRAQQVAITRTGDTTIFWYNSSNTHIATFTFDYCSVLPIYCCVSGNSDYTQTTCDSKTDQIYICVTDDYWGQNCDNWGSVGWNTGTGWVYRPQSEEWKQEYPILTKAPKLSEGITIYPGNYTCYSNYEGEGRFLGNFTDGYCATYSNLPGIAEQDQVQSLGDVYWICGDLKLRMSLEGNWTGECALAKAIMPLHILAAHGHTYSDPAPGHRRKREAPSGSFDPHVYIDAIGVPRGVPDEFKARDQVKAGFESLIPIITVNKNVDWINYIYYNQQRFVNYTRDALQGIADQLGPTSYMTFQNRTAFDMVLAEKGGVCKMIEGIGTCCTYIPDNTGPTGKVTLAIKKLEDLSIELKKNSGITDPWDQYFNWMSGWQKVLAQIGVTVLIILVLLALIVCCVLPFVRKLMGKAVSNSTPMFLHQEEEDPLMTKDEKPFTALKSLPLNSNLTVL